MKINWKIAAVALSALLAAGAAHAKDLHLKWTTPCTNVSADGDSCSGNGGPIGTYLGTDVYGVRFDTGDTLYFGRFPGRPCEPESCVIEVDSTVTMGSVWTYAVNSHAPSCRYASAVWVLPNLPPPPPPPPDTTGGRLTASYYASSSGDTLAWGQPVLVREEPSLDFSWGAGSPGPTVPVDNFRARWVGYVDVPTAGSWTFWLETDDGARMWFDGHWVLSWWGYGPDTEQYFGINTTAGKHLVRVDYLAGDGNAEAHLSWNGPNVAKSKIPSSAWSVGP